MRELRDRAALEVGGGGGRVSEAQESTFWISGDVTRLAGRGVAYAGNPSDIPVLNRLL